MSKAPQRQDTARPVADRIAETFARTWCERIARFAPLERIERDGQPYLTRYFLSGWSPHNRRSGPALFLHHFVASDAHTQVHSHPWGWSLSIILVGGYREQRCTSTGQTDERIYTPGDVNVLMPDDKHRIDLIGKDCWTLFLAGDFAQQWAFSPRC